MKRLLRLIMFIAIALNVQSAMAQTKFTEGVNNVTPYASVNGTYTVVKAGLVTIETQERNFTVTCNNVEANVVTAYSGAYTTRYDVLAKAGDVIHIYSSYYFGSVIRITEIGRNTLPVQLVSVTPSPDNTFSWSSSGMITVQFNKEVKSSGASVSWNGKNYGVSEFRASGSQFVSCNITDALNAAYDAGMKQGESFTVTFNDVVDPDDASNKYNDTGVLTIAYKAPYAQGRLVSAKAGTASLEVGNNDYNFLSYYSLDTEDGIFTFEFSENVGAKPEVSIRMGNVTEDANGKYYYELPDKVWYDGKKVIIDLRGKLRSLAEMFPYVDFSQLDTDEDSRGYVAFDRLDLVLNNVRDTHGNTMYSPGQGTIGSYTFTLKYKELEDNMAYEADSPLEGEVVVEGQNIGVWISEDVKSISSVKVTYYVVEDETLEEPIYAPVTTSYPLSLVANEPYPDGGCIISLDLPTRMNGAVEGEPVRVSMSFTTANDMPHSLTLNYVYKSVTDGIQEVSAATTDTMYNLQGQRISVPRHGQAYIKGGKKYIK